MLKGKRVCVFGGAGSIGSELVRQLAPYNDIYIFDIDETRMFDLVEELGIDGRVGDVRDRESVRESLRVKPDYVFIASSLKHVSPSAWTPREYVQTNIIGTLNIIQEAKCPVINISTDKVVHANSIMGSTKKVAEIAVRDAGGISVRFGNVLGSRGSILEIWKRQLDKNEPLTVTDARATRYMMTIPEAVGLIIRAAEIGEPGAIMILSMGEKVNILDFAKQILRKANKEEKIKMIGLRPGETLTEELMTEEEKERAEKLEDFWIIHNKIK